MWKAMRKIGTFLLSGAFIVTVTIAAVKKIIELFKREPIEVVAEEEVPLKKAAGFGSEVSVPVVKTSRHSKGASSFKPTFVNLRPSRGYVIVPEAFRKRMDESIKNDIYAEAVRHFIEGAADPQSFFISARIARRDIAPISHKYISDQDTEAMLLRLTEEVLDEFGDGPIDEDSVRKAVSAKILAAVQNFAVEPDVLEPEVQRQVLPKPIVIEMVPDYELPKGRGIGPDPDEIEAMMEARRKEQVRLFVANRVFAQLAGENLYTQAVQDLIVKTAAGYIPGSQEFYEAFRHVDRENHPDGNLPSGYAVPTRPLLMSTHEERALFKKYLFDRYEPLDLYKVRGWNEFERHRNELLWSADYIHPGYPIELPVDWEERINHMIQVLMNYVAGYLQDADDDDSVTYLTAIIAHRNSNWGVHNGIGKEPGMALFKYAIFMFRKILYTTPSDADSDEAAETFEAFLNLITVPNPRMAFDRMRHVPHKIAYRK